MPGERWLEAARLAGIRSDRRDTDTQDVALGGEELRARGMKAGGVRAAVAHAEKCRVPGSLAPSGAQQHPRARRARAIRALPGADMLGQEREVWVLLDLRRHVAH